MPPAVARRDGRAGQGLFLLPVPQANPGEPADGLETVWWGLLERVARAALAASAHGPVADVEAESFGGLGRQQAVVWH